MDFCREFYLYLLYPRLGVVSSDDIKLMLNSDPFLGDDINTSSSVT